MNKKVVFVYNIYRKCMMKKMIKIGWVSVIIPILFILAGCAAGTMYTEQKSLDLEMDGIRVLEIICGNGDVGIKGESGGNTLQVTGDIEVSGEDTQKIRDTLNKELVFTVEKRGNRAVLESHFKKSFFLISMFQDQGRSIHMNIEVPDRIKLEIQDNGGNLYISDMKSDITLVDEDGNCVIENVQAGTVEIKDNAGTVTLIDITANIEIDDKSDDIELSGCSGRIQITDTTDALYMDMCSGPLFINDSAGEITIENHTGDVTIEARGRGNITLQNIKGQIIQNF